MAVYICRVAYQNNLLVSTVFTGTPNRALVQEVRPFGLPLLPGCAREVHLRQCGLVLCVSNIHFQFFDLMF